MISRVWHGWTTPGNAAAYETLLLTTVLPGIASRGITGYLGVRLDRRELGDEIEFVTTMFFDSSDAVREFAGPASSESVVPAAARALLSRFDAHAAHYDVVAGSHGNRDFDPADPHSAIQPRIAQAESTIQSDCHAPGSSMDAHTG